MLKSPLGIGLDLLQCPRTHKQLKVIISEKDYHTDNSK